MTSRNRLSKLAFGLGWAAAVFFAFSSPAFANGGESRDVVAPYAYLTNVAIPPSSGPYTTHYLISSATGNNSTMVNVKCYNSVAQRVGPAGGTNIDLTGGPDPGHDMDVVDPVSLGLTTDPDFNGFGWCYFAVTAGDDIAVTFLVGSSVGGNLITTNNSRSIAAGTGEHYVTDDDANIPYWTREGSWDTYVLMLNPTSAASIDMKIDIYGSGSDLQDTWTNNLAARDLDYFNVRSRTLTATWGNMDVSHATSSERGYLGWVSGVNPAGGQGFLYGIPLDIDDISELVGGDRP